MHRASFITRVVAAFVCASSSLHAQSRPATQPFPPHAALPNYLATAPTPATPQPPTLYLHGRCGGPERGCASLRLHHDARLPLLCVRAPTPCDGGGTYWGASPLAHRRHLERLTHLAARAHPDAIDAHHPGVLIAFSDGAYAAMHLLSVTHGQWRAMAFIDAAVTLTRTRLEAAGVTRVVLAAGRRDGSYRTLRATAARLVAEGFAARFVDMGAIGHSPAPARGNTAWDEALAWLESAP